jgi:predicted transcriptional regulator
MSKNQPTKTKSVPPLTLRRLKADMALKNLTLREVAALASVPYVTASNIINGRQIHATYLGRIARAISNARMPREVAA